MPAGQELIVQSAAARGRYTTVAEALRDAATGDTVLFCAGTYSGPTAVVETPGVTLRAQEGAAVILTNAMGPSLIINAACVVAGLTIDTGSKEPALTLATKEAQVQLDRCEVHGCVVRASTRVQATDCLFTRAAGCGLVVCNEAQGEFLRCTARKNKTHGAWLSALPSDSKKIYSLTLLDCTLEGNPRASLVIAAGTPTLRGCTIRGTQPPKATQLKASPGPGQPLTPTGTPPDAEDAVEVSPKKKRKGRRRKADTEEDDERTAETDGTPESTERHAGAVILAAAAPTLAGNTVFASEADGVVVAAEASALPWLDDSGNYGFGALAAPVAATVSPSTVALSPLRVRRSASFLQSAHTRSDDVPTFKKNTVRDNAAVGIRVVGASVRASVDGDELCRNGEAGLRVEDGASVRVVNAVGEEMPRDAPALVAASGGLLTVDRATLRNGDVGCRAEGGGSGLTLTHCNLELCGAVGAEAIHGGTVSLHDCTLTRNGTCLRAATRGSISCGKGVLQHSAKGAWATEQGTVSVSNSMLEHHKVAVVADTGGTARLMKSTVLNSGEAQLMSTTRGVLVASGNSIKDALCPGYVARDGGLGSVTDNLFSDHVATCIAVSTGADPLLQGNEFIASGRDIVEVSSGGAGTFTNNVLRASNHCGFVVTAGGTPTIRGNMVLDQAVVGVDLRDGAAPTVEKNTVRGCGLVGIRVAGRATVAAVLCRNVVEMSPTGVHVTAKAAGAVQRCAIRGCEVGIRCDRGATPSILKCVVDKATTGVIVADPLTRPWLGFLSVQSSLHSGLEVQEEAQAMVQGCVLSNNAVAVLLRPSCRPRFVSNVVTLNDVGVECTEGPCHADFLRNVISHNNCGMHVLGNRPLATAERDMSGSVTPFVALTPTPPPGAVLPSPMARPRALGSSTASSTPPSTAASVSEPAPMLDEEFDERLAPPSVAGPRCRGDHFQANGVGIVVGDGGYCDLSRATVIGQARVGIAVAGNTSQLTTSQCLVSDNGKYNILVCADDPNAADLETDGSGVVADIGRRGSRRPSAAAGPDRINLPAPRRLSRVPSSRKAPDVAAPGPLLRRPSMSKSEPAARGAAAFGQSQTGGLLRRSSQLASAMGSFQRLEAAVGCDVAVQDTVFVGHDSHLAVKLPRDGVRVTRCAFLSAPMTVAAGATPLVCDCLFTARSGAPALPAALILGAKAAAEVLGCIVVGGASDGILVQRGHSRITQTFATRCRGAGLHLAGGSSGPIEHCAFFGNYGCGVRVAGRMSAVGALARCRVFGNTHHAMAELHQHRHRAAHPVRAGQPSGYAGADYTAVKLPDVAEDEPFTGDEPDPSVKGETSRVPKYALPSIDGPGVGIFVEVGAAAVVKDTDVFSNSLANVVLLSSKARSTFTRCASYCTDGFGLVARPGSALDCYDSYFIECAVSGALCESQSTPAFYSCEFADCTIGGVFAGDRGGVFGSRFLGNRVAGIRCVDGATTVVSDCAVRDNGNGIECRLRPTTAPRLLQCDVADNAFCGILCTGCSAPVIDRCRVHGHSGVAAIVVRVESCPRVTRTVLEHNACGMLVRTGSQPQVSGSGFFRNGTGVTSEWGSGGTWTRNRFTGNDAAAIVVRTEAEPLFSRNAFVSDSAIFVSTGGRGHFDRNAFTKARSTCILVTQGGAPRIARTVFSATRALPSDAARLREDALQFVSVAKETGATPEGKAETATLSTFVPRRLQTKSGAVADHGLSVLVRNTGAVTDELPEDRADDDGTSDDDDAFDDGADHPALRFERGGGGTVEHCVFAFNPGTAVVVAGTGSEPLLEGNVFYRNAAVAMSVVDAACPLLKHNVFVQNRAGLRLARTPAIISDCDFVANSLAIDARAAVTGLVTGCSFHDDHLAVDQQPRCGLAVRACAFYAVHTAVQLARGAQGTVSEARFHDTVDVPVRCESLGTTISRSTFFRTRGGIVVGAGATLQLEETEFTGVVDEPAVRVVNSQTTSVMKCSFTDCDVGFATEGRHCVPVVEDTTFLMNRTAINVTARANPTVLRSQLRCNTTGWRSGPDGYGQLKRTTVAGCTTGVHLEGGVDGLPLVSHCNVMDCDGAGIRLTGDAAGDVVDTQVFDCKVGVTATDRAATKLDYTTVSSANARAAGPTALRDEGQATRLQLGQNFQERYDTTKAFANFTKAARLAEDTKTKAVADIAKKKLKAGAEGGLWVVRRRVQGVLLAAGLDPMCNQALPPTDGQLEELLAEDAADEDEDPRAPFVALTQASMRAASVVALQRAESIHSDGSGGAPSALQLDVAGAVRAFSGEDSDEEQPPDAGSRRPSRRASRALRRGLSAAGLRTGDVFRFPGHTGDGAAQKRARPALVRRLKRSVTRKSTVADATARQNSLFAGAFDGTDDETDDESPRPEGGAATARNPRSTSIFPTSGGAPRASVWGNVRGGQRGGSVWGGPTTSAQSLLPPLPDAQPRQEAYPPLPEDARRDARGFPLPRLPVYPPSRLSMQCFATPANSKFGYASRVQRDVVKAAREHNPFFANQALGAFAFADRRAKSELSLSDFAWFVDHVCRTFDHDPADGAPPEQQRERKPSIFKSMVDLAPPGQPREADAPEPEDSTPFVIGFARDAWRLLLEGKPHNEPMTLGDFIKVVAAPHTAMAQLFRMFFSWMDTHGHGAGPEEAEPKDPKAPKEPGTPRRSISDARESVLRADFGMSVTSVVSRRASAV